MRRDLVLLKNDAGKRMDHMFTGPYEEIADEGQNGIIKYENKN